MDKKNLWLLKLDSPVAGSVQAFAGLPPDSRVWQAMDAPLAYAYRSGKSPSDGWHRLECVQQIEGASAASMPLHHYVVETDVLEAHEQDFNAWYAQEHLPGLAAVPGVVRAARYVDASGSPRYYACYDLADLGAFGSQPWLAVRATAWSSRVRPSFRNTRRTMFRLPG